VVIFWCSGYFLKTSGPGEESEIPDVKFCKIIIIIIIAGNIFRVEISPPSTVTVSLQI
jgi:hypothetical protein